MALRMMAELGLDGSGFEAGLRKAETGAHRFGDGMKGFVIGAIGIATVEQAIAKTVETAGQLADEADRLGAPVEQLQILKQAAKDAGSDLDKVASAFEKIDIARQKALGDDAEARKMQNLFGALGVSKGDLGIKTAAELFMGPMAKTVQAGNPAELGALFKGIGVKDLATVMPVLKTDFEELGQKMKKMGGIMDAETVAKLDMLGDELGFLSQIISAQLGPVLVKFTEQMLSFITKSIGGLAALDAYIKGGTKNWTMADKIRNVGFLGVMFPGIAKLTGAKPFDVAAAKKAAVTSASPFEGTLGMMADLQKKMAARAEELRNPKRANFNKSSLPDTISAKALERPNDSFTKVGNFLGGIGVVDNIQQRKISLLQQIANNTARAEARRKEVENHNRNLVISYVEG